MKILTFILINFLTIQKSTQQNTTNGTFCVLRDTWCVFSGVSTSEINPFFNPTNENPLNVTRISFTLSRVPLLNEEICEAFPNLKEYYVVGSSLESIEKDALRQCPNINTFDIFGNFVSELDIDLFESNNELRHIKLENNRFTSIDVRVFRFTLKLEFLSLQNNRLIEFDFKGIVGLRSLKELQLSQNDLLELDENEVEAKFINLDRFYINNNIFLCDRVPVMIESFVERNVSLISGVLFSEKRYNTRKVENIDCLDRNEYNEVVINKIDEFLANSNTQTRFLVDILKSVFQQGTRAEMNFTLATVNFVSAVLLIICLGILAYNGIFWHTTVKRIISGDKGDYYYSYQTGGQETSSME